MSPTQEQLEGAEARGVIQSSTSLSRDMHNKLRDLQKVTQQIESGWRILVVQENGAKRDIWKRKVEQVVEDCDQFRISLERFKSRESRRNAEEQQREELMQRVTSDDEFRLLVNQYDAEAGARISLQRSGGMIDELLAHGSSVLGAIGDQKERLKGAQHKMLDLLNTIGVSASLLRVADRRQRQDAMLVYGGMLVTCVTLLVLWWWLG
jgi:Golgi SNAP receptor complex protein 2